MCGITGIFTKSEEAKIYLDALKNAIASIHHRGPDSSGTYSGMQACLGQTRLSIIDTSPASDQPFYSADKRYAMVFNGEIFNFRELRDGLQKRGISFHTSGDTEVLLHLYLNEGASALEKLNGFFAFAVYDSVEQSLFIARDRSGIKPLFYSTENRNFVFASEMKALLKYPINKKIDTTSLFQYLQLNYIPAPNTILESVKKFPAGHYAKISKDTSLPSFIPFCKEAYPSEISKLPYEDASAKFYTLLDDAVQKRLIADVPVGTFLSGGLDSSAITAIASLHKSDLMTFTIGYKNEPVFDESKYAEMVSKKLNTQHHTFMLGNNDLFEELLKVLDAVDEPFGDSSALPMYILSNKTRQHVKVALSGDGGDELMGGYNKHSAELKMRKYFGISKPLSVIALPLLKALPQSRNTKLGNIVRKASKFAEGAKLNLQDRYWRWASIATLGQAVELLKNKADITIFNERKQAILRLLNDDFNSLLFTDVKLVLQNDMLVKTDIMSMANSLEVRTPLLDFRLVEFLFSLPVAYKIPPGSQKKILRDSVAHMLPSEILTRKKHGFEVPLLKWFQNELRSSIENNWLNDNYIKQQGIFNPDEIIKLKQQLYSSNPQDAVARVWGLIAFQHWYKKNIDN